MSRINTIFKTPRINIVEDGVICESDIARGELILLEHVFMESVGKRKEMVVSVIRSTPILFNSFNT